MAASPSPAASLTSLKLRAAPSPAITRLARWRRRGFIWISRTHLIVDSTISGNSAATAAVSIHQHRLRRQARIPRFATPRFPATRPPSAVAASTITTVLPTIRLLDHHRQHRPSGQRQRRRVLSATRRRSLASARSSSPATPIATSTLSTGATNSFDSLGFNLIGMGNAPREFVAGGRPGQRRQSRPGAPGPQRRTNSHPPRACPAARASTRAIRQLSRRQRAASRNSTSAARPSRASSMATTTEWRPSTSARLSSTKSLMLARRLRTQRHVRNHGHGPRLTAFRNDSRSHDPRQSVSNSPPRRGLLQVRRPRHRQAHVRIYFTHALGDLDLEILDRNGNTIASSPASTTTKKS